jgi:hypothetical protein
VRLLKLCDESCTNPVVSTRSTTTPGGFSGAAAKATEHVTSPRIAAVRSCRVITGGSS